MTATHRPSLRKTSANTTAAHAQRRRPSALVAAHHNQRPCAPQPLRLPAFRPITSEKVWACAPQWTGKSHDSVLREITRPQVLSRYFRGIRLFDAMRASSSAAASPAPQHNLNTGSVEDAAILPTHVIRVHNGRGSAPLAFPFHDVLLATHFGAVSSDVVAAPVPQPEGWQHIVDIAIPAPETFTVFRDYIYNRSTEGLMSSLLPLPANKSKMLPKACPVKSIEHTARFYAKELTRVDLIARAAWVHAVYSNAIRLGMCGDETFWRGVLLAWGIISRALQISQERS